MDTSYTPVVRKGSALELPLSLNWMACPPIGEGVDIRGKAGGLCIGEICGNRVNVPSSQSDLLPDVDRARVTVMELEQLAG